MNEWAASNPLNLYMVASREEAIRTVLTAGFSGSGDEKQAALDVVGRLIGIGIDMRDVDPGRGVV
ncbi:hypothetical protein ABH926_003241 [Catenulispora sp. GP43]|uniref:hypothetical protein n=1 Tax=Catenulispora sp. GP43 TaxID=3156263 RepID=UPI0035181C19